MERKKGINPISLPSSLVGKEKGEIPISIIVPSEGREKGVFPISSARKKKALYIVNASVPDVPSVGRAKSLPFPTT